MRVLGTIANGDLGLYESRMAVMQEGLRSIRPVQRAFAVSQGTIGLLERRILVWKYIVASTICVYVSTSDIYLAVLIRVRAAAIKSLDPPEAPLDLRPHT